MAKSILQTNREKCYLCGRPAQFNDPLDKHHVFFGPFRKKSEEYGLTVYLHHSRCHIFGDDSVHKNAEICRKVQGEAQEIAMERYGWSTEDFIHAFGRNYIQGKILEKDNCCVACGDIVPEGRQVCGMCERKEGVGE